VDCLLEQQVTSPSSEEQQVTSPYDDERPAAAHAEDEDEQGAGRAPDTPPLPYGHDATASLVSLAASIHTPGGDVPTGDVQSDPTGDVPADPMGDVPVGPPPRRRGFFPSLACCFRPRLPEPDVARGDAGRRVELPFTISPPLAEAPPPLLARDFSPGIPPPSAARVYEPQEADPTPAVSSAAEVGEE